MFHQIGGWFLFLAEGQDSLFCEKSHGGCNIPLECCEEPPFESDGLK